MLPAMRVGRKVPKRCEEEISKSPSGCVCPFKKDAIHAFEKKLLNQILSRLYTKTPASQIDECRFPVSLSQKVEQILANRTVMARRRYHIPGCAGKLARFGLFRLVAQGDQDGIAIPSMQACPLKSTLGYPSQERSRFKLLASTTKPKTIGKRSADFP